MEVTEINHFSRLRYHVPVTSCPDETFVNPVCVCRMGVQYGHRVSVPQLAGVCPRRSSSRHHLPGWSHLHAREPTLPAGGETARSGLC